MSEKIPEHSPEKHRDPETIPSREHLSDQELQSEKAKGDKEKEQKLEQARESIEKSAKNKEAYPGREEAKHDREPVTRYHKRQGYQATMSRVESKLPAPARAFSRFVHNDTIDKASHILGSTVARPSGILGAGLTGFIGLSIFLFYANRIGFELSGAELIYLIIGGWLAGVLIESVIKLVRLRKSR